MHLTPREQDKLLLFLAGEVARQRRARGLKLNYPEAVALITSELMERARDGMSVSELMSYGATILRPGDVMEGVPEMLHEAQVEATFPDGTKLVTVHDPIRANTDAGPGEYALREEPVIANAGRPVTVLPVRNTGDRPVQVGSHYHFYEVNAALLFDREQARGLRLNIAAGTAVRFEPGEQKDVTLVPYAGQREVWGHRAMVNGAL